MRLLTIFLIFSLSLYSQLGAYFCPVCKKESKTSKVYPGWCSTTTVASIAYYDERGKYQYTDPNTTSCSYSCSRGHQWSSETYHGATTNKIIKDTETKSSTQFGDMVPSGSFITLGDITGTEKPTIIGIDLTFEKVYMFSLKDGNTVEFNNKQLNSMFELYNTLKNSK